MPLLRVIQKTYKLRFVCLIGGRANCSLLNRVYPHEALQSLNVLVTIWFVIFGYNGGVSSSVFSKTDRKATIIVVNIKF